MTTGVLKLSFHPHFEAAVSHGTTVKGVHARIRCAFNIKLQG